MWKVRKNVCQKANVCVTPGKPKRCPGSEKSGTHGKRVEKGAEGFHNGETWVSRRRVGRRSGPGRRGQCPVEQESPLMCRSNAIGDEVGEGLRSGRGWPAGVCENRAAIIPEVRAEVLERFLTVGPPCSEGRALSDHVPEGLLWGAARPAGVPGEACRIGGRLQREGRPVQGLVA